MAVEALVHLAHRTLGRLRQVRERTQGSSSAEYVRDVLCIDRTHQEVIDMLHREQFSGMTRGKSSQGRLDRGRYTHPANPDALDDSDSDGSTRPGKRAKPKWKAHPAAPKLLGPPPCYLWVAGKCTGLTCKQPAMRTNKGPHPHSWDKRDKGTQTQAEFTVWVKKYY